MGMKLKPWKSDVPTLDEVASALPEYAPILRGERDILTPPTISPVWRSVMHGYRSRTEVSAAVFGYSYYSDYRDCKIVVSITLIQIIESEQGTDGGASVRLYRHDGPLTRDETIYRTRLILAGLPKLIGSADL